MCVSLNCNIDYWTLLVCLEDRVWSNNTYRLYSGLDSASNVERNAPLLLAGLYSYSTIRLGIYWVSCHCVINCTNSKHSCFIKCHQLGEHMPHVRYREDSSKIYANLILLTISVLLPGYQIFFSRVYRTVDLPTADESVQRSLFDNWVSLSYKNTFLVLCVSKICGP